MDREEAAKELMAMLEEAQEGPYYSEEEVRAHLLEILACLLYTSDAADE